jgi:Ca2+-binding RTX toxin-like protein
MATYNLYQLDATLTEAGYSQPVRAQVEDYLLANGLLSTNPSTTIDVETTPGTGGSPSPAQLLIFNPPQSETIQTGPGTPNPDLAYILDPAVFGTTLTITGTANVGISLTDSPSEKLVLQDSGNDVVYTGSGTDSVDATAATGADTFYVAGSGPSTIDGGAGSATAGDTFVALPGSGASKLVSGSVSGGQGAVLDDYSSAADTLQGGGGADSLYSSNTVGDTLLAGTGNNSLRDFAPYTLDGVTYGGGSNSMEGGSGLDTLVAASTGNDTLQGGSGDNLLLALAGSGAAHLISGSTGAAGSYNILDDYSSAADTLQGGAGPDSLWSNNTVGDTLLAGTGNNLLEDFAPNTIDGVTYGGGSNSMQGGSGADTLVSNSTGSDTLHGGSGHNLLQVNAGAGSGELISGSTSAPGSWNILEDYSSTAHTLQGGGGADSLYSNNSSGDTLITGSGNDQVLTAITGNNSLEAGSGSGTGDVLNAGAGNDTLDGSQNSNSEAFYSGAGNSTMDGGSGEDFFTDLTKGSDTVTINTGSGSPADYVDFRYAGGTGYNYADASGAPPAGSTAANVTLTFGGQTVDINSNPGTTVNLVFNDQTVTYKG